VNKSIRVLDLKDNPIGDAGNTALAQALAINDTVEELSLRQTKMTWQAGIEWGKAMGLNSTLVRVDLRANKIGDTGIGLVTTSLAASKALEYLNIADNQVRFLLWISASGPGKLLERFLGKSITSRETRRKKVFEHAARCAGHLFGYSFFAFLGADFSPR
jgi:Ran GTPase-activating protein (RanGAP) involved in mRNA processing and transport